MARGWRKVRSGSACRAGHTAFGAAISTPVGLPARRELAYAMERFRTLDLNRAFYSLVTPKA